jgi:hypothetical protein
MHVGGLFILFFCEPSRPAIKDIFLISLDCGELR